MFKALVGEQSTLNIMIGKITLKTPKLLPNSQLKKKEKKEGKKVELIVKPIRTI